MKRKADMAIRYIRVQLKPARYHSDKDPIEVKGRVSPDFSPVEVAVYPRSEAMNYSCLCSLLQRRKRRGKIGWPSVNIVKISV
ncbi:MAG: hypothetical protein ABR512_15720 [Desulfopila sp.]